MLASSWLVFVFASLAFVVVYGTRGRMPDSYSFESRDIQEREKKEILNRVDATKDRETSAEETPDNHFTETEESLRTNYRNFFDGLDSNGDGKISFEELKAAAIAHKVTEEFMANVEGEFKKNDQNGDGEIDMEEYVASIIRSLDDKDAIFNVIDTNEDKKLSFEEVMVAMAFFQNEKEMDREQIEEDFKKADKDNDGLVDKKEWAAAVDRASPRTRTEKEHFNEIDKDGDGKISMNELRAMFAAANFPEAFVAKEEAAFKEADSNGDGFVDWKEYKAAVARVEDSEKNGRYTDDIFNSFDVDGDGKFSFEEAKAAATAQGLGITEEDVARAREEFKLADMDGNGFVDRAEYYFIVRKAKSDWQKTDARSTPPATTTTQDESTTIPLLSTTQASVDISKGHVKWYSLEDLLSTRAPQTESRKVEHDEASKKANTYDDGFFNNAEYDNAVDLEKKEEGTALP